MDTKNYWMPIFLVEGMRMFGGAATVVAGIVNTAGKMAEEAADFVEKTTLPSGPEVSLDNYVQMNIEGDYVLMNKVKSSEEGKPSDKDDPFDKDITTLSLEVCELRGGEPEYNVR